jgi:hypothetical protein
MLLMTKEATLFQRQAIVARLKTYLQDHLKIVLNSIVAVEYQCLPQEWTNPDYREPDSLISRSPQ